MAVKFDVLLLILGMYFMALEKNSQIEYQA